MRSNQLLLHILAVTAPSRRVKHPTPNFKTMIYQQFPTPICDFVHRYAISGTARFHMPGHKGLYPHDITEIKGADSLYEAGGIIRESEGYASELFGTAATFYSTEGSSQCIRAMLALATCFDLANGSNSKNFNSKNHSSSDGCRTAARPVILAARNVHRAFITAAALLDLDIRWLYPEDSSYSLCSCHICAEQVRDAIVSMDVKPVAVYITSPDYLGNIADIKAISQVVHEYGIMLLVDNAHGAYLHFLKQPIHPIDLGADMCCDSAHKTLPALTGCAYLHISKNAPSSCISNARKALSLFGSTSPSYLLLQSLDKVNEYLSGNWPYRLVECIDRINKCKQIITDCGFVILSESFPTSDHRRINNALVPDSRESDNAGISRQCLSNNNHNTFNYYSCEPCKITIFASRSGINGQQLADELRNYKIECEYADPDFVVLMISSNNSEKDLNRLCEAAREIAAAYKIKAAQSDYNDISTLPLLRPLQALSIREAFLSCSREVPVEEAVGMICADTAITCPPAIPIVVCGEIISDSALPIFRHYNIDRISIIDSGVKWPITA